MNFLFATCRIGAEAQLKLEAQRLGLRPALMRPGFVSFKSDTPVAPKLRFEAVFAHAFAASLGRASSATVATAVSAFAAKLGAVRVHSYARGLLADEGVATSGLSALSVAGLPGGAAADGEMVLDVVCVDADAYMLGAHVHSEAHSPFPGGMPALVKPEDAPSRAWLKFEEALLWHPQKPQPAEIAIEIGSAPGGTALALLSRGLKVYAIDPAEMDPSLRGRVVHLKKPAAYLGRSDIDENARWLLIDINDTPDLAMKIIEKMVAFVRARPALILTLKMSDWRRAAELPDIERRVRSLGYARVRLRQLTLGRREVVLVAAGAEGD